MPEKESTVVRWHVNADGVAGKCKAKKKCRFNIPLDDHADTPLKAYYKWASKEGLLDPPTLSKETIIVSDLDGTLIRSSLLLENAVALHESGGVDLGDTPARWKSDKKNEDLITELAEKYLASLKGHSEEYANALGTVNMLLSNHENFYTTLSDLIEHRRKGNRVVLITGSPDFLVKHLAGAFGFEFHSSSYGRDEDGLFDGTINLMAGGEAKRKVLGQLGLQDYQTVIGLGDTASDSPLLAAADEAILVEPTQHTLDHLREQSIKVDKIIYK